MTRVTAAPLWAQLFALDDSTGLPLQARLRLKIVRAILDGRLAVGAPLPSSRDLALALGLGRSTVTAVYQQLIDEDYLDSRPRSGVFVKAGARPATIGETAGGPHPAGPDGAASGAAPDWARRLRRSLIKLGGADGREEAFDPDVWASVLRGYERTFGA